MVFFCNAWLRKPYILSIEREREPSSKCYIFSILSYKSFSFSVCSWLRQSMTGCYMYVAPSSNKSVNHQVNVLKMMFPYRGVWNVKGQIIGFMILLEISHSSLKSEYVVCHIGIKQSSKVWNVTVIDVL